MIMARATRKHGSIDKSILPIECVSFAMALIFAIATPTAADDLEGASTDSVAGDHAAEETGAVACLKCHESKTVMGILDTPHAKASDPRSPAARQQCEACHGPSARHMEYPMQIGNIRFTKQSTTSAVEQNKACLACHHDGEREHWNAGPHGFDEISCATCHKAHRPKDPVLLKEHQTQSCTDSCHAKVLDQAQQHSTHPVMGGEITCADCHNPHGPIRSDRCALCHPQVSEAFAKQPQKAREFHETAKAKGIDCMRCHAGIAHAIPERAAEMGTSNASKP
jgi:predicted CXXCH cytochrome family protein